MYDRALLRDLLAQAQFEDVKIESRQVPITGASARTIATGQIRGTPRSLLIEKRGVELEDVIEKVTAALTKVGGDPYQGVTKSIVLPLSGANSPRTVEMLYNCPGQDFRAAMKTTAIQSRSEERRVGKECRSRWSRDHEKKKV